MSPFSFSVSPSGSRKQIVVMRVMLPLVIQARGSDAAKLIVWLVSG